MSRSDRIPYIRVLVMMLGSLAFGAAAGGCIVYNRVALRYRQQYEAVCLAEIENSLLLVEKLRNGKTAEVIKGYDVYLGRSALGLRNEGAHSPRTGYILWQIKKHFRDRKLPTDPDLESLFKQIPDEEP